MAVPTRFEIRNEDAFPHGTFAFLATEVKPARDFDASTPGNEVQARDEKGTGLPLWTFDVLDADPAAQGKNAAITVRIASEYMPTLPEAPAGSPVRPEEFEGLTATPYVDSQRCNGNSQRCRSRLAWSFRATGIRGPEPKSAARGPASKAGREQAA